MSTQKLRINWPTSLFLVTSLLVAVCGAPWYFWKYGFHTFDLVHFLVMMVLTGMSITVGYHRLFTHRTFNATWPVKLGTLLFGAASFESSALTWASDHRYHHKYTDQDGDPHDPHSIKRGFFWAHVGWLLQHQQPARIPDNVEDLRRDPLVRWQDRYYLPLAIGFGFGLPALVGVLYAQLSGGSLAAGAIGGLLIAGCTRIVVVQHCTFFINSLCHCIGRQPYDSEGSPRDNGILAIFTFGEGYHNYHHAFQTDYRNGIRFWHWDPGKWAIWTLSKLGLASGLHRVPEETVRLAVIREKRRRLEARLSTHRAELSEQLAFLMADLENRLEQVHLRCRVLLGEYSKLASQRFGERRAQMRQVRDEIRQVRQEFRRLTREWHLTHRLALVQVTA